MQHRDHANTFDLEGLKTGLWVYPKEGHQTFESSTFVYGWAPGDVIVRVQGDIVSEAPSFEFGLRSESGYFAAKVPLKIGENTLTLEWQKNGAALSETEDITVVRRVAPKKDNRVNVFGALHLVASLDDAGEDSSLCYEPLEKPEWFLFKNTEPVILRSGPSSHASRLTPLQVGARVCVLAIVCNKQQTERWAVIDIGEGQHGYCLIENDAMWESCSREGVTDLTAFGLQPLRVLETRAFNDEGFEVSGISLRTKVALPMAHWPAMQIVSQCDDVSGMRPLINQANQLKCVLPQCEHRADVIRFDPLDLVVKTLRCKALAQGSLGLQVDVNRLAGYGFWEDKNSSDDYGVCERGIWVQSLPADKKDWRIVLDPGHGGDELGTIAPNGLPEKELNLKVAMAAQKALQAAGFNHVCLTRQSDQEIPLAERVAWIQAQSPHIVLSLHHNALPDGRDPIAHEGLSTYYYHDFSRPLARHLLSSMSESLNTPAYGLFEDSLALPRIHEAMSVLVEYGFTTHPNDAERLLSALYPEKAANALVQALTRFAEVYG